MNNMKINCLEELAEHIVDMQVKYCGFKPSELDKREIIADFVNDCDCIGWIEDFPLNEETYPLFKYVFIHYEAHDEWEKQYMKMIFEANVSLENMRTQAYVDFSDFIKEIKPGVDSAKNKFELYSAIFCLENWLGLDQYKQ